MEDWTPPHPLLRFPAFPADPGGPGLFPVPGHVQRPQRPRRGRAIERQDLGQRQRGRVLDLQRDRLLRGHHRQPSGHQMDPQRGRTRLLPVRLQLSELQP